MKRGIIFDCDGVLVDSEHISTQVFGDMIRENGTQIDNQYIYNELKGGSIHESLAFVRPYLKDRNSYDIEKEYRMRTFKAFKQQLKAIPDVSTLLASLTIPKCVASNGPMEKILLNLKITGLLSHFDQDKIFSAHTLQVFKPSPELFLYAANQMGINPENCIVVEDSVHGVQAARNAGMQCYGYAAQTDADELFAEGAIPFYHMSDLHELIEIES